jgi:phytol kinase
MIDLHPALSVGLFVVALAAVMCGMRLAQKRFAIHPELSRKIVHISLGLATLSFPWLFRESWPVVALAALTVAIMAALRWVPSLQSLFGEVLGGVRRFSLGEFYYPIAVATVFVLSQGDPLLFCVPLLILTLADAVAALIGVRYGTRRFVTIDTKKSVEGSVAFFMVAFFTAHVPLLLWTQTGRAESLLIALTLALLVMILEAVSWRGLDNLLIPLGGFLLLKTYLHTDARELTWLLGITAGMFMFVMFWGSKTSLRDSALLAGVLVLFLCFRFGDWRWLVAPVAVLVSYTALFPRTLGTQRRSQGFAAVASVSGAGLIWLFLASWRDRPELLYVFTLAFAAHLAMIGVARIKHAKPAMAMPLIIGLCTMESGLLLMIPYVFLAGATREHVALGLAGIVPIALAAIAFALIQPGLAAFPTDIARWTRQGIVATAASALGLLALQGLASP